MIWIPNGFRADSKRIPFAYIRNVTLRNATSLYGTVVRLRLLIIRCSSVPRESAVG